MLNTQYLVSSRRLLIMLFKVALVVRLIGSILFLKAHYCANILITEDLASPSHQIWNYAIADALVDRGNNVTILGPKTISIENKKFHFIPLEGLYEATDALGAFLPEELAQTSVLGNIQLYNDFSIFACNHSLHTEGLQRLLNYPADFKFDLIIQDLTMSQCFLPLIERFNSPAVGVSALILPPFLSELMGNSFPVSYLPYILSKNRAGMNFLERLQNVIYSKVDFYWKTYYAFPIMEQMSRKVFGKMQNFATLRKRISLLLCNLSPGFHYPQPLTPNIIPVGGLHIDTKKKLPRDLQDLMDSATNGVILFSLGSNLRSDSLRPEKRNNILKAFSQLKQTVLWKFETDIPNLPNNVIIKKWIPQTDILAHPNLKLFITHGGGLSTIEAAFYGVPMIGIPFFVDQFSNMELVETREIGETLVYDSLTSESLLTTINTVLTDGKYAKNARKISSIMKDQPQTSLERAIFWIEFAIRNNGSNIYDPQSRHISGFVSSSFDVYSFFLLLLTLFVYFVSKILKVLSRLLNWNQKKIKTN